MMHTHGFRITRPFQSASNRIAVAGNEHAERAGACPGDNEEFILADNRDQRLDRSGIGRLRDGQKREEGGFAEIDHVVILLVCDAEATAHPAGKGGALG
jgi:hypothetical protein